MNFLWKIDADYLKVNFIPEEAFTLKLVHVVLIYSQSLFGIPRLSITKVLGINYNKPNSALENAHYQYLQYSHYLSEFLAIK